jgi:hypothetical protein
MIKAGWVMNRVALLSVFICIGGAWTEPVAGQSPLEVRVIPRLGLLAPDEFFYEEFTNFSGDGPVEWTTGSLGRAAFVGLGLEVGSQERGIFVRGEVARSFEGWLSAVHGVLIPRVLFEPPQVVNTWLDVPAALTFASLQVILHTRLQFRGIQPFVLAGFTGKWYGFGSPTSENTVDAILPTDGFTPSADLGGGVTFRLLGLTLEGQLKDSINRYWGKTQHDLIVSGGVLWRVR